MARNLLRERVELGQVPDVVRANLDLIWSVLLELGGHLQSLRRLVAFLMLGILAEIHHLVLRDGRLEGRGGADWLLGGLDIDVLEVLRLRLLRFELSLHDVVRGCLDAHGREVAGLPLLSWRWQLYLHPWHAVKHLICTSRGVGG